MADPVSDFLVDIKLAKYQAKFSENGIDDMETVMQLNEEHLTQMGIPLGHKLKIMKRIKAMSRPATADQQATSVSAAATDTQSETTNVSQPVA